MSGRDSEVVLWVWSPACFIVGVHVVCDSDAHRTKSMMRESEKHLKEITDVLQVYSYAHIMAFLTHACMHTSSTEAVTSI